MQIDNRISGINGWPTRLLLHKLACPCHMYIHVVPVPCKLKFHLLADEGICWHKTFPKLLHHFSVPPTPLPGVNYSPQPTSSPTFHSHLLTHSCCLYDHIHTHSLTHTPTHSLTHTHSLTYSCTHTLTHPLTLTHSHSLTHSLSYALTYMYMYIHTHYLLLYIHVYTYTFLHLTYFMSPPPSFQPSLSSSLIEALNPKYM